MIKNVAEFTKNTGQVDNMMSEDGNCDKMTAEKVITL